MKEKQRKVMPVSAAKAAYADKLNSLLDKYDRILFVQIIHVRSQQLHAIRRDLRGKAELLMGKKTLQKRVICNRAEEGEENLLKEKLVDAGILVGNRGMLFTFESIESVQAVLKKHRI